MSTYANLHPKYIFGLNDTCKGINVWFVDNNTIMYPAGNAVVMFSLDQKTQTFLHGVEKGRGVSALTVSNNRMYAAVAQLGEKPSILIIDLKTNKRRKALQYSETVAEEYVSLAFTHDNLHLASLTGSPEFNLVFWKWDKGRMVCVSKTSNLGPVLEISASPLENNVMCTVGKSSFRFFRFNESHMKPFGFQKGDTYNFLCHAWLGKGDRVVAGTVDGRLMLFERGEYRFDVPIKKLELTAGKSKIMNGDGDTTTTRNDSTEISTNWARASLSGSYEGVEITAITAYSKGFAIGYGMGSVLIFEEQLVYDTPEEHYKHLHTVRIPASTSVHEDRIVNSLAVSLNEETLIATTKGSQIYSFSLSNTEIKEASEMVFEFANCSFHHGPVLSMDVATRKSLLVTCGEDKFIRIWNFLTLTQEVSKEFAEEIFCVSMHPTGLFVLAGCIDKIRMFTVLIDDIRELKDWTVRSVKELRFSNGGHLFAAANSNILQLYSTTTLELVATMKGHSNKIKRITWALDDSKLITAGADGAIYEWDTQTYKRTADVVDRGSHLISVAVTPDCKTHYAINGHNLLKEIQIHEGMILKELELGAEPCYIDLSRSGKILLVGFRDGIVRSFRQPLTYAGEWFDYHLHSGAVTCVLSTFDEIFCVSCSSGNEIIFWKMTDADGRMAKLEKDLTYASEILITKQDIDERQVAMNEMKQRYSELKMEMEYSLKRKDLSFQEEIKELNSMFTMQISDLNAKVDQLVSAKEKSDEEYKTFAQEVLQRHVTKTENMEANFNTKLIAEFEKYNSLQNLLEETIKEYEERLISLEEDRRKAIEEMVEYFEGKIKDKNSSLEQAFNDARTQMMEGEEMKKQIEEDADTEILEMSTLYERKLKYEKETNAKLRSEAGMMRQKLKSMQKEIEDNKSEVQKLITDTVKLKKVIATLEKQLTSMKKEMLDREENIADKEKMYNDMKKENAELEKYKYVLDDRVKELKKVIEPKEREIMNLKSQIAYMELELDNTIVVRNGLQLEVNELMRKLRVADKEYHSERRMRWKSNVLVRRVRAHLSQALALQQDHKALKACVKSMYMKYGRNFEGVKVTPAEQEAICELVRQKNHLEAYLTSIKRKVSKDTDLTRAEQLKVMRENMLLVTEINNLRRELKTVRDKITCYENMLGVAQTSHASEAAEIRIKLQHAIEDRDEIDIAHEEELDAQDLLLKTQRMQLEHINAKLLKISECVSEIRPNSAPTSAIEYIRAVLTSS